MPFVTLEEYNSAKLYTLEDRVYNQVRRAFEKAVGYGIAEKLLAKFAGMTLRELSANSYVDILSAVTIL